MDFDLEAKTHIGQSILHVATMQGNLPMVQALVDMGASLLTKTYQGWTLLHTASQHGHVDLVEYFCELYANGTPIALEAENCIGLRPFHLAISRGHLRIASILMEHGSQIQYDHEQYSPLHVAALVGRRACCSFLLREGASVDKQNLSGNTPLHLAAMEDELEIVQMLLDGQERPDLTLLNDEGQTCVQVAKKNCQSPLQEAMRYVPWYNPRIQLTRDSSCRDIIKTCLLFFKVEWTKEKLPTEVVALVCEYLSQGLSRTEYLSLTGYYLSGIDTSLYIRGLQRNIAREILKLH
ncbi:Ankyrin repeat domain-containing protein 16 [Kappamyces sp. JEL0680]|nr:Ankyrin repeat domain-containing protein 16 [Kappamyces sp. JEL0680]